MRGPTREDSVGVDALVFGVVLRASAVLHDEYERAWCLLGACGWAEAT